MRNTGLIGLVLAVIVTAAVVVTAAVAGKTQVLLLKDGREFTGQITKTTTGYQIKTKLAVLTFAKDQVEKITDVANPEEEYERRVAEIDPNDARAHFKLGKWAYEQGLLKIAKKELLRALEIDKELERATLLLKRVEDDLSRTSTTGPVEPNNGGTGQIPDEWLVTKEDIYRIRIAEFKFKGSGKLDTSASVKFDNNVVERFITMMQGESEKFDARKFKGMSPYNKLKTILSETEEESILKDIQLDRDPWVMGEFRGIWRLVALKCGSLTCHGAPKGQGQFKLLLNVGAKRDRVLYSNFLILSQYTKGQGRMLDRDIVGESLLLHYGLPLDDEKVKYRHPGKKKLNPAPFPTVGNKNYLDIQKWIGSLRGPPYGGNYEVKYQAPFGPKPEPPLILNPTTRPKDK